MKTIKIIRFAVFAFLAVMLSHTSFAAQRIYPALDENLRREEITVQTEIAEIKIKEAQNIINKAREEAFRGIINSSQAEKIIQEQEAIINGIRNALAQVLNQTIEKREADEAEESFVNFLAEKKKANLAIDNARLQFLKGTMASSEAIKIIKEQNALIDKITDERSNRGKVIVAHDQVPESPLSSFISGAKNFGARALAPFKYTEEQKIAQKVIDGLMKQQSQLTKDYKMARAGKLTPVAREILQDRYEKIIAEIKDEIHQQQLITGAAMTTERKLFWAAVAAGAAVAGMYLLAPGTAITTDETPANVTGETPANVTGETPANVTGETPANVTGETPTNVTGETPANVTGETPTNVTGETPTNVMDETPTNVTDETPTNVTGETPANVTGETPTNVTGETPANVTGETPANVTGETPANVTGETPANVTGETPTNVTGETPTNVTGETPTNVMDETPTNVTDETPTNVTDETPTNVTDETPTNVMDETPTNVTGETPTNVTGETPINEVRESNNILVEQGLGGLKEYEESKIQEELDTQNKQLDDQTSLTSNGTDKASGLADDQQQLLLDEFNDELNQETKQTDSEEQKASQDSDSANNEEVNQESPVATTSSDNQAEEQQDVTASTNDVTKNDETAQNRVDSSKKTDKDKGKFFDSWEALEQWMQDNPENTGDQGTKNSSSNQVDQLSSEKKN